VFVLLLVGLLAAAAIHVVLARPVARERGAEIVLLWVLIGYCGVPGVAISLFDLIRPDALAHRFGFPPGGASQVFLGWAYLAMSVLSVLAIRYRGAYLIGPAVAWSIFFAGATFVHLGEGHRTGSLTHPYALIIFASHGLVTVVLAGALLASGLLRARGPTEGTS